MAKNSVKSGLSKNKLGKVPGYMSNVGKSVGYATFNKLKKMNPAISSFSESNNDIFKTVYRSAIDYRITYKRGVDSFKKTQLYEAANIGLNAIKEDLRTGNLYNRERQKQIDEANMSKFTGSDQTFDLGGIDSDFGSDDDWGDFGDMDFDDTDSSNDLEGDMLVSNTIEGTSKANAQAISSAVVRAAEYQGETSIRNTNLMYTFQTREFGKMNSTLTAINSNFGEVLQYLDKNVSLHLENSTKFYEKATPMLEDSVALLRQIAENTTVKVPEENKKKNKITYGDIVDANGMPNFDEYAKRIGKNIVNYMNEQTMGAGSLLTSMGDANLLASFAANPFGTMMDFAMDKITPKAIEKGFAEFNKSLGGFFGSYITKMNNMAKDDDGSFLSRMIGSIFGINPSKKNSIDVSNYNKGKVEWTGKSEKALTEIIPNKLEKIISLLSGKEEQVYDYNRGSYKSISGLQKEYENFENKFWKSASSDIMSAMNEQVERNLAFNNKQEKDDLLKDIENLFKNLYSEGKLLDINNRKLSEKYYDYNVTTQQNMEIIRALAQNIPRSQWHQYNNNMNEQFENQKKEYERMEKEGTFNVLFNNSDFNEFAKEINGKKNKKQLKTKLNQSALIDTKDILGHNIFWYMQRIYKELNYIRQYGGTGGYMDDYDRPSFNTVTKNLIPIDDKVKDKPNDATKEREKRERENQSFLERQQRHIEKSKEGKDSKLVNVNDLSDEELFGSITSNIEYNNDMDRIINNRNNNRRDTLLQRVIAAETASDKMKTIANKMEELLKKPGEFIEATLHKADEHLFTLIYGKEGIGEEKQIKGFLDAMLYKMNNMFANYNTFMEEKILNPLKDALGLDQAKGLFKGLMDRFGITDKVTDMKQRASDGFKGVKENLNAVWGDVKTSVSDTLKEITSPITDKLNERNVFKRNDQQFGLSEEEIEKLLEEALDNSSGLDPEKRNEFNNIMLRNRLNNLGFNNLVDTNPLSSFLLNSQQFEQNTTNSKIEAIREELMQRRNDMISNNDFKTNSYKLLNPDFAEQIPKMTGYTSSISTSIDTIEDILKKMYKAMTDVDYVSDKPELEPNPLRVETNGPLVNPMPSTPDIPDYMKNGLPVSRNENKVVNNFMSDVTSEVKNTLYRSGASNPDEIRNAIERSVRRNGIPGFAKGGYVDKDRLAVVGKGEYVLTKEKQAALSRIMAQQIRGLQGQKGGINGANMSKEARNLYRQLVTELGAENMDPNMVMSLLTSGESANAFAEIQTREESKKIADMVNRVKYAMGQRNEGSLDDTGMLVQDGRENIFSDAFNVYKSTIDKTLEVIYGDKDAVKEKKKNFDAMSGVMKDAKLYGSELVTGGLLGGGVSLLTGMIGGPLLGAGIGAGVALTRRNKWLQDKLFGEAVTDEEGNVISRKANGLVPSSIVDKVTTAMPDLKKYGITGALAGSILKFVPFGPVGGLVLGSAAAYAKNSGYFQEHLFGDGKALSKENIKKFQDRMPQMLAGAMGGVAATFLPIPTPFGLMGNMLLGTGVGFLSKTDKFQKWLFGEYNEQTKSYEGGMVTKAKESIIDPLVKDIKSIGSTFKNWFKRDIIDPVASAFKPLTKQLKLMGKHTVGKFFNWAISKIIGVPAKKVQKRLQKLFSPLKDLGGRAARFVGKRISAPFRAIGFLGRRAKMHQMNIGEADYMGAQERLDYAGAQNDMGFFYNEANKQVKENRRQVSKQMLDRFGATDAAKLEALMRSGSYKTAKKLINKRFGHVQDDESKQVRDSMLANIDQYQSLLGGRLTFNTYGDKQALAKNLEDQYRSQWEQYNNTHDEQIDFDSFMRMMVGKKYTKKHDKVRYNYQHVDEMIAGTADEDLEKLNQMFNASSKTDDEYDKSRKDTVKRINEMLKQEGVKLSFGQRREIVSSLKMGKYDYALKLVENAMNEKGVKAESFDDYDNIKSMINDFGVTDKLRVDKNGLNNQFESMLQSMFGSDLKFSSDIERNKFFKIVQDELKYRNKNNKHLSKEDVKDNPVQDNVSIITETIMKMQDVMDEQKELAEETLKFMKESRDNRSEKELNEQRNSLDYKVYRSEQQLDNKQNERFDLIRSMGYKSIEEAPSRLLSMNIKKLRAESKKFTKDMKEIESSETVGSGFKKKFGFGEPERIETKTVFNSDGEPLKMRKDTKTGDWEPDNTDTETKQTIKNTAIAKRKQNLFYDKFLGMANKQEDAEKEEKKSKGGWLMKLLTALGIGKSILKGIGGKLFGGVGKLFGLGGTGTLARLATSLFGGLGKGVLLIGGLMFLPQIMNGFNKYIAPTLSKSWNETIKPWLQNDGIPMIKNGLITLVKAIPSMLAGTIKFITGELIPTILKGWFGTEADTAYKNFGEGTVKSINNKAKKESLNIQNTLKDNKIKNTNVKENIFDKDYSTLKSENTKQLNMFDQVEDVTKNTNRQVNMFDQVEDTTKNTNKQLNMFDQIEDTTKNTNNIITDSEQLNMFDKIEQAEDAVKNAETAVKNAERSTIKKSSKDLFRNSTGLAKVKNGFNAVKEGIGNATHSIKNNKVLSAGAKVAKKIGKVGSKLIPGNKLFKAGAKIGKYSVKAWKATTDKMGKALGKLYKKTGETKVAKKLAEQAIKVGESDAVKTLAKKVESALVKVFNNKVVVKLLGTENGKNVAAELIENFVPQVVKKIESAGAEEAARILGGIATGGIVNIAFAVHDFSYGFNHAATVLGIATEPTKGQKITAAIFNTIMGLIPGINLIPSNILFNLVAKVLKPLGLAGKTMEQREQAQATVDAYNKENNTDYTLEKYNEEVGNDKKTLLEKAGGAISSGWNKITGFFGGNKKKENKKTEEPKKEGKGESFGKGVMNKLVGKGPSIESTGASQKLVAQKMIKASMITMGGISPISSAASTALSVFNNTINSNNSGLVESAAKNIENIFVKVFTDNTIVNLLGVTSSGKNGYSCASMILASFVPQLIQKLKSNCQSSSNKNISAYLSVLLNSSSISNISNVIADFINAFNSPQKYIGNEETYTTGMKTIAGILAVANGRLVVDVVLPQSDWISLIEKHILPIFGETKEQVRSINEQAVKAAKQYTVTASSSQAQKNAVQSIIEGKARKQSSSSSSSTNIFQKITNTGKNIANKIGSTVKSVTNGISSGINKVKDTIGNAMSSTLSFFGGLFGKGEGKSEPLFGKGEASSVNGNPYFSQKEASGSLHNMMSDAGCGPTAAAMALSKVTGRNVSPEGIASRGLKSGSWDSEGSRGSLFSESAKEVGAQSVSSGGDFSRFDRMVSAGIPTVVSGTVGRGDASPYTSAGHLVTVFGKDSNGNYLVNDPRGKGYSGAYSKEQLMNGFNNSWSFGKGGKEDYNNGNDYGGYDADLAKVKESELEKDFSKSELKRLVGKGDPTTLTYKNGFPYWSQIAFGGNIKMAGCGPTSVAMIASYNKGKAISPKKAVNDASGHGWTASSGATINAISYLAKKYGLDHSSMLTSISQVDKYLKEGYPVVINGHRGDLAGIPWATRCMKSCYSPAGHYLVALGKDGSDYVINDPRGSKYSGRRPADHVRKGFVKAMKVGNKKFKLDKSKISDLGLESNESGAISGDGSDSGSTDGTTTEETTTSAPDFFSEMATSAVNFSKKLFGFDIEETTTETTEDSGSTDDGSDDGTIAEGKMSGSSVAEKIFSYFKSVGATPEFAAAVVGNAYRETNLKPSSDSSGCHGVFSHYDTKLLDEYSKKSGKKWKNNLEAQLEQEWQQLNGKQSDKYTNYLIKRDWGSVSKFIKQNDIVTAANEWDRLVERSGDSVKRCLKYTGKKFPKGKQAIDSSKHDDSANGQIGLRAKFSKQWYKKLVKAAGKGDIEGLGELLFGTGKTSDDKVKLASKIIEYAISFIGHKFSYSQPSRDWINHNKNRSDCSSFVHHVYDRCSGIEVGAYTDGMMNKGDTIKSIKDLVPSDIILFQNTSGKGSGKPSHAAIYIGDGKFIHSSSTPVNGCNIKISSLNESYYKSKFLVAKRHIDPNKKVDPEVKNPNKLTGFKKAKGSYSIPDDAKAGSNTDQVSDTSSDNNSGESSGTTTASGTDFFGDMATSAVNFSKKLFGFDIEETSSSSDSGSSDTNSAISGDGATVQANNKGTFPKYSLSDSQIKAIARVVEGEQGDYAGYCAEASLIGNHADCFGTQSVANVVEKAHNNWFAGGSKANFNNTSKTPSSSAVKAVKQTLVEGKRTLPRYIDEHDCINPDIRTVTNNGNSVSKTNKSNYKSHVSKVHTKYMDPGEYWTFYSFPGPHDDPFGYTPTYGKYRSKWGDDCYSPSQGKGEGNCKDGVCGKGEDDFFESTLNGIESQGYGFSDNGEYHTGVDYGAKEGTPIKTPISGKIVESKKDNKYGFGNTVAIRDNEGNTHRFAHLMNKSSFGLGDTVSKNDVIGQVGNTGRSTGSHLHYQINDKKGVSVNPKEYMNNRGGTKNNVNDAVLSFKDSKEKVKVSVGKGDGGSIGSEALIKLINIIITLLTKVSNNSESITEIVEILKGMKSGNTTSTTNSKNNKASKSAKQKHTQNMLSALQQSMNSSDAADDATIDNIINVLERLASE